MGITIIGTPAHVVCPLDGQPRALLSGRVHNEPVQHRLQFRVSTVRRLEEDGVVYRQQHTAAIVSGTQVIVHSHQARHDDIGTRALDAGVNRLPVHTLAVASRIQSEREAPATPEVCVDEVMGVCEPLRFDHIPLHTWIGDEELIEIMLSLLLGYRYTHAIPELSLESGSAYFIDRSEIPIPYRMLATSCATLAGAACYHADETISSPR